MTIEKGLEILVMGGQPLEHAALLERLKAEGADVFEAADYAATLQFSQNRKLDLIVLIEPFPRVLPLREIIRTLRAKNTTTKLLVFSNNELPERVRAILIAGADGYVYKGEDVETILRAIDVVAKGDVWISRNLINALTSAPLPHPPEDQQEIDLTERERQVLNLIADGLSNAEIGASLHLAQQTVRNYSSRIYEKLGVHTHAEAIVWVIENGFSQH